MKYYLWIAFLSIGLQNAIAQKDTLNQKKVINLDEVVVSAQIEPQSIKKSIKSVQIISQEQIKNLGASTLGDVLNQYINITVVPDGNTGRSTVSLFGLDASYFKVLVDNIPLVNEGGFGNNTDLSQINLDDIERIEIIEGSMGVTHGANAVSGILNIITKQKISNKWNIIYSAQEESIGKEYDFKEKGRHIQSFKASHNINDRWLVSVGTNRNKFNGFLGNSGGKKVLYSSENRGYEFLPRVLLQNNALLNYHSDKFNAFYKFELMNQDISYYDTAVKSAYNDTYGSYKYGEDRRYFYKRQFHHLNLSGKSFVNYNLSFSYQKQSRENESFRYLIIQDIENNNRKEKVEAMEVLYSKGDFSKSFYDKKLAIALGYETALNKGFAIVNEAQNKTKDVNANINNYDAYLVSEYHFTDNFSIRLGGRYSFQSLFENQYSYSLGTRYLLPYGIEWRASVGKSYRTPEFSELYSNIIFEGHYFLGNENLIPEGSLSLDTSLKKTTFFSNQNKLKNQITLSYNHITDRITNALIGYERATPIYQYINISKYKYINLASTNNWMVNNFDFNLGASFTWISQTIDNNEYQTDDRYLLNIGANAGLTYRIPKWKTSISAYYKLRGKTQLWTATTNGYTIGDINAYSWLDASIKKDFFKRKLELTVGARNLLNITSVSRSLETSGHSTSSSILLGYGRSYFVKLSYNLNINY
ncbi:MAG: TonB-dependent receptor [Capnocytophaga sp.]|nr:TonB-dependent receptor [Capnocytophaga sp.]